MTTQTSQSTSPTSPTSPTSSRRPTLAFPTRGARPPSVPIRIADRLGPYFAPNACVAGYGYFANGRVVLAMTSESTGHATVRGKRTQMVHLEAHDGELATSCTCASNALEMTGCRHVWAAVLEADRTGVFASLRESPRPLKLRARSEAPPAAEAPPEKPKGPAKSETPEKSGKTGKNGRSEKKPTKPKAPARPTTTTDEARPTAKATKKTRTSKR